MKNKISLLYILVIILVLQNFKAWMFLTYSAQWGFVIGPIIYLLLAANKPLLSFDKNRLTFVIASFLCMSYTMKLHDIGGFVGTFLNSSALFAIILLQDNFRIELLRLFDRIMYWITAAAVICWVLFLFNIPLPHFQYVCEMGDDSIYNLDIYYFFCFWDRGLITDIFPRFSSMFYEPGYSSIILVFLILYHKFDFKEWPTRVYTVGLLFSLSLAGYLMFAVMWAAYSVSNSKKGILRLCVLVAILSASYNFFKDYNGGNNAINEMIISRMEIEDGEWSGYNRTQDTFDDEFDKFLTSGGTEFFFGVSTSKLSMVHEANVGWKVYLYANGFLCFLLFLYSIYIVFKPYRFKILCYLPMILYFLTFARGHRVMWFSGYWLLYVCIATFFFYEDNTPKIKEME